MQASIFSCSTAFLAWEMLAVLLLAIPSFIVLLLQQRHAQRGWGGMESMNITLNPQSNIPWSDVFALLLERPFSTTTFFYLKGPILSGESVKQQPSSIFSPSSSQLVIFSVNAPAWLFIYWLFFGWWWWWGYKETKHQSTPLCSNITIGWLAQGH